MLLDNLKQIIEIAHKHDPLETEYLVAKRVDYILKTSSGIYNEILTLESKVDRELNLTEREEAEIYRLESQYNILEDEANILSNFISRLK